jgi:hypothetical protein
LKPGNYICQINVIDDSGGSFSFPRMALIVQPGSMAPVVVPAAANATPSSAPTP